MELNECRYCGEAKRWEYVCRECVEERSEADDLKVDEQLMNK